MIIVGAWSEREREIREHTLNYIIMMGIHVVENLIYADATSSLIKKGVDDEKT
jgi:hypothetical protein